MSQVLQKTELPERSKPARMPVLTGNSGQQWRDSRQGRRATFDSPALKVIVPDTAQGQSATNKHDTFPYTRYGTVAADYLLSPIQRAGSESLRER